MRLVFVADAIPPEPRRIVELLNAQMRETQVVAVEIKQFVGEGLKTLAPKVIGLTEEARARKSTARSAGREWDEASFFAALAERDPDGVAAARRIYEWARESLPGSSWGHGNEGSFTLKLMREGVWYPVVALWTGGTLECQFEYLRTKSPFNGAEMRAALPRRFNEIPSVNIDESTVGGTPVRRPRIRLDVLAEEGALQKLFAALEWFIDTVRAEE
ncbi:MAG: hypothetical protein WCP98_09170 [Actinomycetes bacterium]